MSKKQNSSDTKPATTDIVLKQHQQQIMPNQTPVVKRV